MAAAEIDSIQGEHAGDSRLTGEGEESDGELHGCWIKNAYILSPCSREMIAMISLARPTV